MKKFSKILSVLLIFAIAVTAAAGCSFRSTGSGGGNGSGMTAERQTVVFNTEEEGERTLYSNYAQAYEAVKRTSVAIIMSTAEGTSAGSGVIVDVQYESGANNKDVYIVTCHHVVESGGDITLYLPDENCRYDNEDYIFEGYIGGDITGENAVSLIGGDKTSDIAVIKLDLSKPALSGTRLSADNIVKAQVPTEEGYSLSVAEEVFAIGNPTGELPGSFSAGYISYLDRVVSVADIGDMHLVQIDVTSNHGNSGGGLYNLYGELVGITNAGNDDYQQINFAIPFESVSAEENNGFVRIAEELLSTYTGANYGFVEGHRESFGFTVLESNGSVGVAAITAGSQAESAGLKVGDIITGIAQNGGTKISVSSVADVSGVIERLVFGDTVTIYGERQKSSFPWGGSSYEDFSVTLTARQYRFCDTGK